MGMNVTSLTQNGLRDWLVQRATAVIIGFYVLCVMGFLYKHAPVSYVAWHAFIWHPWMKVFSFLAVLSVAAHAWIGLWTVTTDYIKCACLRLALQGLIALFLLGCLGTGLVVLWGI